MADEAGNLSYKDLQHHFISNLNGTTLSEIALVVSSAPLAVMLRTCLGLSLFGSMTSASALRSSSIILLDYTTLVIPVLATFTFLANNALTTLITMATIICGIIAMVTTFMKNTKTKDHLLETKMSERRPFICNFRAYVLVATAICILAVDFTIFPRRFAKAETYGSGLMDVGVGSFVISNALVSPEARQGNKSTKSLLGSVLRSVKSSSPLLVLGIMRCLAVKSTDYQEHVSEYGVHWNFFFTLFVVRVLSAIIVRLIPGSRLYGIAGLSIAILYQYCLTNTGLRQFILHGSQGDGSRNGLVDANREGLISCTGYLALYLMGLQIGTFLFIKRDTFGLWLRAFVVMVFVDAIFWILTAACGHYISHVSRRMGNLAFVLWQTAYNTQLLASFLLVDMVMTVVHKIAMTEGSQSAGCPICYPNDDQTALKREPIRRHHCACLVAAINRNQLVYFLLANLLTGLVNFSVKTLFCGTVISLVIICGYMFVLNLVTLALHVHNITMRFR